MCALCHHGVEIERNSLKLAPGCTANLLTIGRDCRDDEYEKAKRMVVETTQWTQPLPVQRSPAVLAASPHRQRRNVIKLGRLCRMPLTAISSKA